LRSSVVISERDRFRGVAPSSDVGAGRDLAGVLEVVDEGGDGEDSVGWHGCDDRRVRLEALREEESRMAITLRSLRGSLLKEVKEEREEIQRKKPREGGLRRRRTYVVVSEEECCHVDIAN
jgi:hypothetical protein